MVVSAVDLLYVFGRSFVLSDQVPSIIVQFGKGTHRGVSYIVCVQELGFFVKTSKPRQTRARLGNVELADEAELVSLAVG